MIPLGVLASSHVAEPPPIFFGSWTDIFVASGSVTPGAGDLLLAMSFRSGSSAPALPAGWTSLGTQTNVGFTARIGYKIATSSGAQSTGDWTGAEYLGVAVYQGAGAPTKMAWGSNGTPALSGLTPGAWLAAFVILPMGEVGPAVAGLTTRSDYLWDTGEPVLGRAATSDPNAYWTALVEVPPGT